MRKKVKLGEITVSKRKEKDKQTGFNKRYKGVVGGKRELDDACRNALDAQMGPHMAVGTPSRPIQRGVGEVSHIVGGVVTAELRVA